MAFGQHQSRLIEVYGKYPQFTEINVCVCVCVCVFVCVCVNIEP